MRLCAIDTEVAGGSVSDMKADCCAGVERLDSDKAFEAETIARGMVDVSTE